MVNYQTLNKLQAESQTIKTVTRKWTSKKTGETTIKTYTYAAESPVLFTKTKKGYKLKEKAWNDFEANIRKASATQYEADSLIKEARRIRNDILSAKVEELPPNTTEDFTQSDIKRMSQKQHEFGGYRQYKSHTKYQTGWNRIDTKSMISRLASDGWAKYIINLGLSPEKIAEEYNITLDELLNDANWQSIEHTSEADFQGIDIFGNILKLHFAWAYNEEEAITVLQQTKESE